ncbi:hypothetical protein KR032_009561 [Drosophila birchii]|nr:hypothetical protein KR032_009561 [Drosophila birchii]
MFDWVRLLLRAGYYYGLMIGIGNFEVDWRNGHVFTTTRCTLYAIASNVVIVVLFALHLIENASYTSVVFGGTNQIYVYVVITMAILRLLAGFSTLLNQWRSQSQQMLLVKNLLRLCLARPQLIRMSRWRILLMFCISLVTNLFQLAVTLGSIHHADPKLYLGIVLYFWIATILSLYMAQHYVLMLYIWSQYNLLNEELKQVIEESKYLSYNLSRKAAVMTRCCTLADQLDDIAKLQDHLQSIVAQLIGVFGIQGLLIFSAYYISALVTIYTTYSILKANADDLGINLKNQILSFTQFFFFYMIGILNLFMVVHIQDSHKNMICLLDERTLFAPGLDVRLEQSFESLQLQLIRNPLKMDIIKLFPVSRQALWAMVGSILLHSISLIQYDIENFNK